MGKFVLFPIAKFEYDEAGGSIIDLLNYERINYNKTEKDCLLNLFNADIDNVNDLDIQSKRIIKRLIDNGYGYIYKNNVYNDTHLKNRVFEIRGLAEDIPYFSKIYLEIGNKCNLKCAYCSDDIKVGSACNTCIKWKKHNDETAKKFNFYNIIKRICKLWVEEFVFSGGNPILERELLIEYILLIRNILPKVKISINFNGCGLDNELTYFFAEHNIRLNITVLGYDSKSYLATTNEVNVFDEVKKNIKLCVDNNVEYYVVFLGNYNKEKNTGLDFDSASDIIYNSHVYSGEYMICKEDTFEERKKRISVNYELNQKFNSCLNGRLAITSTGIIKPCPMIDDELLDLNNSSFNDLFQHEIIDRYWRFTKRNVKLCSKCPYKYSCEDCTAIEIEMNKGTINPKLVCDR